MDTQLSRREFLAGVAGAALGGAALAEQAPPIERRPLGRARAPVSILALGGGSQFMRAVRNEDEALALLNAAIDGGINYLDTAPEYGRGESERYFGLVAAQRRAEIFLATKVHARSEDGALREVEQSLRSLRTDRLDLLQIHSILPADTLETLTRPGGVYRALLRLKGEGVVRCIGISGHTSAIRMKELVERLEGLDTVLCPINPQPDQRETRRAPLGEHDEQFERLLLPAALAAGVSVVAMKATAQGKLLGEGPGKADAETLIRYTMSTPGSTATVLGPGSLENLRANLRLAQQFRPFTDAERRRIAAGWAGDAQQPPPLRPGRRDA